MVLRDLRTIGGTLFPAGELVRVAFAGNKDALIFAEPCRCCNQSRDISRVPYENLTVAEGPIREH